MEPGSWPDLGRRRLLGGTLFGGLASLLLGRPSAAQVPSEPRAMDAHRAHNGASHGALMTVGDVDHARNGFDPHDVLTAWDTGAVSTLPDGRRLREFTVTAVEHEIEIAPGVFFPAWSYNGRVPGPTLRA